MVAVNNMLWVMRLYKITGELKAGHLIELNYWQEIMLLMVMVIGWQEATSSGGGQEEDQQQQ